MKYTRHVFYRRKLERLKFILILAYAFVKLIKAVKDLIKNWVCME